MLSSPRMMVSVCFTGSKILLDMSDKKQMLLDEGGEYTLYK